VFHAVSMEAAFKGTAVVTLLSSHCLLHRPPPLNPHYPQSPPPPDTPAPAST
jgi:hypothetical protein